MMRIMVVEDEQPQADLIKYLLQNISDDYKEQAGIDGVEITLANCASKARQLLEQARADQKPYDLLLLDLGLPENPLENEKPELGVDILRVAKDKEAARGIIVISVFDELERYVRLGASDFIGKPYDKEELPVRVLNAWVQVKEMRWQRMVNDIMKESLRELAPYADKGISYQLSSCFSRLTQSVRRGTEEMRNGLFKHLNLGPVDTLPDPLEQRLTAMEETIRKGREEWKEIQEPFKIADESPHGVIVEQEVARHAEKLRPCVNIRLKTPPERETRILSFRDKFRDNAEVVIREILAGGLSEETDFSKLLEIAVEVASGDGTGMAQIHFRDNFNPIRADLAKEITNGDNIAPGNGQWRAWGLSVVQHIALRGGGRLIVEPQDDGNLITYLVTLAQDV